MGMFAATVRELIAAGLSGRALADAVERIEEAAARPMTGAERTARWRAKNKANGDDVTGDVTVTVAPLPDKEKCPKEINPSPLSSDANASGAAAPPDERTKLFRWGLETIQRMTGRQPETVRKLLGRWLKALNDDCRGLNRILEDAVAANPAEPVAWIEGVIRSRSTGPPGYRTQNGFAALALEMNGLSHADQRSDDRYPPGERAGPDPPGAFTIAGYPAQRR
jgi:hypothetical protein